MALHIVNKVRQLMKDHFSETLSLFLFVIFVIINERDRLFSGAQVIQHYKSRQFTNNTQLVDFVNGSLAFLYEREYSSRKVLIYGYSPWDADSQNLLTLFNNFANLNSDFYPVVINCWIHHGDCFRNYRFDRYPKFMVKLPDFKMQLYHGPLDILYLQKWLNGMSQAYHVVYDDLELRSLLNRYKSVVIGCFDFRTLSKSHNLNYFFSASLYHHSIMSSIVYAVPRYSNSELFSCPLLGSIFVLSSGESSPMSYLLNGNSTKLIIEFVNAQVDTLPSSTYKPLISSGMKSRRLFDQFNETTHPAVMFVFDEFHIPDHSKLHHELTFLSHFYGNCNQSFEELYSDDVETYGCHSERGNTRNTAEYLICSLFLLYGSIDSSLSKIIDFHSHQSSLLFQLYSTLFGNSVWKLSDSVASDSQTRHFLYQNVLQRCKSAQFNSVFHFDRCSYLVNHYNRLSKLNHLACSRNKSLRFFLLDKNSNSALLNSFGVHSEARSPVAVIINIKQEVVYKRYIDNFEQLVQFIEHYHSKSLTQFRRFSRNIDSHTQSVFLSNRIVVLNSLIFDRVVFESSDDCLVLFIDRHCGFCNQYLVAFNQLSSYLFKAPNLTIAYVDLNDNDVHPRVHPLRVPYAVLYPSGDKYNPVVFRSELNLKNLVEFVVRYSKAGVGLYSFTGLSCGSKCIQQQISNLKQHLVTLTTKSTRANDVISSCLLLAQESRHAASYCYAHFQFGRQSTQSDKLCCDSYHALTQKQSLFEVLATRARSIYRKYCENRQRTNKLLRMLQNSQSDISWSKLFSTHAFQ